MRCEDLTQKYYQGQAVGGGSTMTRELIILKIFWGNKCVGDDKEDDDLGQ